jgi:ribosomal protein S18 acetylase RimI-like enzyme
MTPTSDPLAEVTFRPIRDADEPFLSRLYASTRQEELAVTDWSEERKAAFLEQQFQAQHTFYREQFTDAEFSIVELRGKPAGRLYLDRRDDEIRLIDIALLPEHRNRGIGGALMRRVLAEGEERGLPVRIHVERFNPALRLYRRLGFRRVEEQGPYFLMEWAPAAAGE